MIHTFRFRSVRDVLDGWCSTYAHVCVTGDEDGVEGGERDKEIGGRRGRKGLTWFMFG